MSNRQNPPESWKRQLGNKCWNCGATEGVAYHHIVPVGADLIGREVLSNMCCLCPKCHGAIHIGKDGIKGNNSELIKIGMKRVQANGVHVGKPAADYEKIMKIIAENLTVFEGGTLTENEILNLMSEKRTTFHKVRRMLYEDLEKDTWTHSFPKPKRILKMPLYEYQILEARQKGTPIRIVQEQRIKNGGGY